MNDVADMDKIYEAKRLCDVGFNSYDQKYYSKIDELLSGVEQTPSVQRARRLCAAGPTLSSPKFAYPHIKDAL